MNGATLALLALGLYLPIFWQLPLWRSEAMYALIPQEMLAACSWPNLDFALILGGEFVDDGRDGAAGATPGGPKINESYSIATTEHDQQRAGRAKLADYHRRKHIQ